MSFSAKDTPPHVFHSPATIAAMLRDAWPEKDGSYRGGCPAHNSKSGNSLRISQGVTGHTVLHCFSGCKVPDIVEALGLTVSNLFPEPPSKTSSNGQKNDMGTFVEAYDYTDAAGMLLYQNVRFANPKSFRQRRPDGKGGWLWNVKDINPVLYRLRQVLAAMTQGQPIYICEGERDVHTLETYGLVATTNSAGADAWKPTHAEVLQGAHVVILEDNDQAGRKRTDVIGSSLHGKAASVRIVRFAELPEHGDVSDWLALGHTAAELQQRIDAAPMWEPTPAGETPKQSRLILTRMSDVIEKEQEWLWWPYIPRGAVTMADGDPGLGKSLLMLNLGAVLSRGWPLPDQQGIPTLPTGAPQNVLLLSAEDALASVVKKRLREAQADDTRFTALEGWLGPEDEERAFTLQHIDILREAIGDTKAALVVIDPIQAYLGAIDMYRANETRPLMSALNKTCQEFRAAVVCVRHPSKPGQGGIKAIHRGLGSVDLIGAARSGLLVDAHPCDPTKALFFHIKSNGGILGRTQVFSKTEGIFQWAGVTRLTAQHISGRGPDPYAFLECFSFLEDTLGDGIPQSVADDSPLQQALTEEGFKLDTIRRAKKALNIRSVKQGDSWLWTLDALSPIHPPVSTTVTSITTDTTDTTVTSIPSININTYERSFQDVEDVQDVEVTEEVQVTVVLPEQVPFFGKECSHAWTATNGDDYSCDLCGAVR